MAKITLDEAKNVINFDCKSRIDLKLRHRNVYNFLQRRNLLETYLSHLPKHTNGNHKEKVIFSPSDIQKIANKYQVRVDFKLGHRVAYEQARKLKIIDQVCKHMKYGAKGSVVDYKFTDQELITRAKKYNSRALMSQKDSGPYRTILKRNLQFKAFKHMTSELGRPEAIFQAKVISLLSKNLPKAKLLEEFWLDSNSRVDILIKYQDKYYILEVKSEKSKHGWSKNKVQEQMNRYQEAGKFLYKDQFMGSFLISEEGLIGMKPSKFLKILKK